MREFVTETLFKALCVLGMVVGTGVACWAVYENFHDTEPHVWVIHIK